MMKQPIDPEPPDRKPPEKATSAKPSIRSRILRSRPLSWWWVVTSLSMALLLGLGFLEGIRLFAGPIALLIVGISLAAGVAPLVDRLSTRIPRNLAILMVYLAIAAGFALLFWIIIPPLGSQMEGLLDRAPQWIAQIQQWIAQSGLAPPGSLGQGFSGQLGAFGNSLVALPMRLITWVVDLILIYVISIYWLLAAPSIRGFFLSLFPPERHPAITDLIEDLGTAMGGYIRGTVIDGVIVAGIIYIGLRAIGIDYPLVLSLLSGILEFIPVLGPFIAGIAMGLVALSQSPGQALIVVIFALLVQQFENHLLVPNIMRSQTNITPLLAVIAIFAGAAIGGLVGALVAIPLAAGFRVLLNRLVIPAVRRAAGAPEPEADTS